MKYYIDSSVLVKWFKKDEENAAIALQIRKDILNGVVSCYISEYSLLERDNGKEVGIVETGLGACPRSAIAP